MPTSKRPFAPGDLQFPTSSTYRRAKLFERDGFRWSFVEVLGQLRIEMGFLLIGWVLMPDHFHLLIKPEPTASTSRFMQELKKGTPQRILSALSENQRVPWYGKMRAWLRLLPTVQADSEFRLWQRRFYPFGVHSERKRLEKLNYIHDNPVFALMIFGTTVGRSIANIGQNEATSKTRKTKTAKKETKNTKATKMTQSASTGNLLLGSNRQASG